MLSKAGIGRTFAGIKLTHIVFFQHEMGVIERVVEKCQVGKKAILSVEKIYKRTGGGLNHWTRSSIFKLTSKYSVSHVSHWKWPKFDYERYKLLQKNRSIPIS